VFYDYSYFLEEFGAEYSGVSTWPQVGIFIVMNKALSTATLTKSKQRQKLED
jgi:hypothetical protein